MRQNRREVGGNWAKVGRCKWERKQGRVAEWGWVGRDERARFPPKLVRVGDCVEDECASEVHEVTVAAAHPTG